MPRIIITALFFAAIFLFPAAALAVDMDFYTYGGFEPVVDAFTQISLIFGNSSYQALYYTSVICGIGFGAMAAYITLVGGRGNNILGWAPIAALGMSIYIGLFVPKGNLVVYDPVFNKFQTVPNVPNGVVIVAGSLNAIERGLVDIVSNSASPTAYQTQAGGIGFMGLYNLATLPATAGSSFLDMNINRYIQDCVSFALNNPASGLTVDELRKTTTSFATSFAKAKNPAITTLYYSAANPQGVPQACDADWAQISTTDLTAAALQNNINSACSTLNYDITDPLQLSQCQANLINLATAGNLTTGDINSLMQQIYLYNRLDQYYQNGNTTAITNYSFLMNASGSMKAADEWIPVLKAILTAIAVSLIPLLAIFIPTPICGRTLNLMFGLFLWLALWGICDAIIYQFALSYGFKVWDAVRQNNLGMDAFYFFPNMTVKALAMFGTLRMGGLLLATALATMLTRFGGSVMGMLAGNITGQVQAAGTSAEWKTTDPSGRAQSLEANTRALPTEAWAASHSLAARGGEIYADRSTGTEAYKTMSDNFGGPQGAAHMGALGKIGREVGFAGKGEAMQGSPEGLPGAFGLGKFIASADLTKTADTQSAFGTPDSYGHAQAAEPVALANVAAANGMSPEVLALARERFNQAMGYGEQKTVQSFLGTAEPLIAGNALGDARGMQDMHQVKHADQVRAAANYAAPVSWKSDLNLYEKSKHELTPLGVGLFIGSMEGRIGYHTAHGSATLDLGSDGKPVMSSQVGIMPGSDNMAIQQLADDLDKNGLFNEAAAVRAFGAYSKTFGFGASYDPRGNIAGFTAERGGAVTSDDLSKSTTGKDMQKINRNITAEETGLRKTVGDFIKIGYSNEQFNVKSFTGSRTIDVGGKRQLVNGEWYYAHDNQAGENTLIGGAFINGMNGNVLMFQKGQDGAIHYAQVQGKFDANGNLVSGNATEITRTNFVESIKDYEGNVTGLAVVERQGTSGIPSVAANAQGGKHIDMSNTFIIPSTGVTSAQTLAGSTVQGEFEQGSQLGVGAAATTIAIGERSIEVAADKISQGTTVGNILRDPAGTRAQERANFERCRENARQTTERHAEQVKRESSAKTTRTLQHQSKTSSLPKSGGPPPLKPRKH